MIPDRHVFVFNEDANGGECLSLTTTFYETSGELQMSQELSLQSYCNYATIGLIGAVMTPEILRELANKLETRMLQYQNEIIVNEIHELE